MQPFKSPSHKLTTTDPEQLSTTDDTGYAGICVIARDGSSSMQCGGKDITATTGGKRLASGDGFWFAIPGRQVRLTEIYVAGTINDYADTICVPF